MGVEGSADSAEIIKAVENAGYTAAEKGKENKTAVTPDYEIKTLAELPRLLPEL